MSEEDAEDIELEEVTEDEEESYEEGDEMDDVSEGLDDEDRGMGVGDLDGEEYATQDVGDDDVNVNTFDELKLEPNFIAAINETWKAFLVTAESPEQAGEALYSTIYESAPSLQPLFVSPRAVQAMRFFQGLAGFIQALAEPPRLKILVETLSFGHLQFDVTVPRVAIFRDAIVDLFIVELADIFTPQARSAWCKLLNYVGGAFIYVRVHYAERINTLLKSWKQVNLGKIADENAGEGGLMDSAEARVEEALKSKTKDNKQNMKKEKTQANNAPKGKGADSKVSEKEANLASQAQTIPRTFAEMFTYNTAIMGFRKSTWMFEVLACFDNIVTNVANSARLQEECDILALRIAKVAKGHVHLAEYKSCMLASLRNLLPKDWDTAHEVAWNWLWENVERLVTKIAGKPAVWEKALSQLLQNLDEDKKYEIRQNIYAAFFSAAPAGQDFFKQSNTYLHFIADKVMNMTLEIYQDPVKKVDDISAVGLRHVGYGIHTELFGPFVTACVETLSGATDDEVSIEAYRWSLGLISKMLVRTINEGSTIAMRAINANSRKLLKKAVGCAPRGERCDWMLTVQVGTQSISPFAWSVESGNFEAARAIIQDLLTIRADRERYYYGFDPLFKRHPDVIKMLCDKAPDLVPLLLDGLLWRSRSVEGGLRRVNYYVKHLLVDGEGGFSKALKWISDKRDPKLVCHPVVIFVADVVWSKIAYMSFLYGKMWLFLTLVIFMISQSVLEYVDDGAQTANQRTGAFACRIFIYAFSMTELIFKHARKSWHAYKSGMMTKKFCIKYPTYLTQWQETSSFVLTISLICMLGLEPIFHCWSHQDGKLFFQRCHDHMSRLRYAYSSFSSVAMFLYYLLLLGLAVVSTRISAFVLVCARMLSEVHLFLLALGGTILTFSNAISVLEHESEDFAGIHKGAYSLIRMFLGTFSSERFAHFRDEPTVLAVAVLFMIVTTIFLGNMLIAQLICAYSAVYDDMVGYARLERATTIVEIMPSIPVKRWNRFVESCLFNKRLEFYIGDIGLAGGIQIWEPGSANPTNVDTVRRFAGSTSPDIQWPADDEDGDGQDRFERMEKLIQKTSKQMQKMLQARETRKGKGGTSGGMSMSTSLQQGEDDEFDD